MRVVNDTGKGQSKTWEWRLKVQGSRGSRVGSRNKCEGRISRGSAWTLVVIRNYYTTV